MEGLVTIVTDIHNNLRQQPSPSPSTRTENSTTFPYNQEDEEIDNSESNPIQIPVTLSHPQTRTAMFSAGIPAGATVPIKIKNKIWTHKYIDFHDLLHPDETASTIQ